MPNKKTQAQQLEELQGGFAKELEILEKQSGKLTANGNEVKSNLTILLDAIEKSKKNFTMLRGIKDPAEMQRSFYTSRKALTENLRSFFEQNPQPTTKEEKTLFDSFTRLTKNLATYGEILEDFGKSLKISNEIYHRNDDPDYDQHMMEYYDKNLSENFGMVRPAIKECCEMSVEEHEPAEIFRRMLSLADYTSRFRHPEQTNLYQQTLNQLVNEIEEASFGKKMEYLKLFNDFSNACRAKETECPAFTKMMRLFGNGTMGKMIYAHNPKINELTLASNRNELVKELPMDENIHTLGYCYSQLLQDKGKSTPVFDAVKNAMENFIALDHEQVDHDKIDKQYVQALERVVDTARIFLSPYKKDPSNPEQLARVNTIRLLSLEANNRLSVVQEQFERAQTKELEQSEQGIKDQDLDEVEENLELARLHRHITPVRMVPKNPEYSFEPSRISKFFRALGHYAYSALNMLIANTIGRLVSNVARPFTQRNKRRPANDLDVDLIPGGNGEKFTKFNPGDFGPEQPILSDIRRTPLVWEKPIPGNPNDKPTVSFNFSQGKEGDATSAVEGGTGHAHICLTYSKPNPLTGKMQRYSVSFGFYPKGGFNTKNIEIAQYLNGLRIPGTLVNDAGNNYAVGKKFVVNNQQINEILVAAHEYEKDGYNAITRNCTTFVADMAKKAKIDVENILKEVDYTAEVSKTNTKLMGGIGLAGIFAAPLFTRLAKRDVLNKVGKKDLSYQNLGQDMLNAQDVKRLWSLDFNTRMKGYSPNHASENIRHEKGSVLHSKQYKGKALKLQSNEREFFNSVAVALSNELILMERALDTAWDVSQAQHVAKVSEQASKYCKYMTRALTTQLSEINEANGQHLIQDEEAIEETYGKADSIINEFITGLNSIYHDAFHENQAMNISMNHVVSILEHVQERVRESYAEYLNVFQEIPEERDNCYAVKDLYGKGIEVTTRIEINENDGMKEYNPTFSYTPACMVGMIKAFGSLKKAMEADVTMNALQKGRLTLSNSEKTKLVRTFKVAKEFENAEKSFFSGRELTKADYKFVFTDLPNAMKEVGITNQRNSPVYVYRSEIFAQLFKGVKKEFKEYSLQVLTDDKIFQKGEALYKFLEDSLVAKMSTPKGQEMVANIKEALTPSAMESRKQVFGQSDEAYEKTIQKGVNFDFKEMLKKNYIQELTNDVFTELRKLPDVDLHCLMNQFSSLARSVNYRNLSNVSKVIAKDREPSIEKEPKVKAKESMGVPNV